MLRSLGLRGRIALLVLLVLLPLATLNAMEISRRRDQRIAVELERTERLAEFGAAAFTAYIQHIWALQRTVGSTIIHAKQPLSEPDLKQLLVQTPLPLAVRGLGFVSPTGYGVSSTRSFQGYIGDREYFQRLVGGADHIVSDFLPEGRAAQAPSIIVATALRREGSLVGILISGVDPTLLGRALFPLSAGVTESMAFGLVDRQGVVVFVSTNPELPLEERPLAPDAQRPERQALGGKPTSMRSFAATANGDRRLGSAHPVPELGWAAFAHLPEPQVMAPVRVETFRLVLILLLVTALSLVGVLAAANTTIAPVLALQRAAAEISAGNLGARTGWHGKHEAAVAAQTFDQMAAQIQSMQTLLRTHVNRQAGLAYLGVTALSGRDLHRLIDDALWLVSNGLDVELTKVLELQPDGTELLLRAGLGWRDGLVGQATVGTGGDSQAGYTLRSGGPVIVADLNTEERFSGPALLQEHGVVSGLSTVIQGLGRPYGVLGAYTTGRRTFTAEDADFLQSVAHVLSAAIQRKHSEAELNRLLQITQRWAEQQQALTLSALSVNASLSITDLLQVVAEQTRVILGTDWSAVRLETGEAAESGTPTEEVGLCFPLQDQFGEPLGQLQVAGTEGETDPADMAAASQLAYMAAVAIQNARLYQAVQAAQRQYEQLVHNLDAIVWEADPLTLQFEFVSRGAQQTLGYSLAEWQSPDFLARLLHPDDRDMVLQQRHHRSQAGQDHEVQYRVLTLLGETLWVHERVHVETDADGRPVRLRGVMVDISGQKQAEAELRRSQERVLLATESGHIGFWDWDISRGDPLVSPNMPDMHGLQPEQWPLTLQAYAALIHPPDRRSTVAVVQAAIKGRSDDYDVEYRFQPPNGPQRWIHSQGKVLRDPASGSVRLIGISLDVTQRRDNEEQIRRLNADLEARVAARTAELTTAIAELEAFSYSVSHDLRQPLRTIDGFSLALIEDYGQDLDAEAHDYLGRIRTAAQRMGSLIDALLGLSRVTRAGMKRETVDLSRMADSILAELQARSPERRVSITIAKGLRVRGDERLLQIALENLLQNAWKFTGRREEAAITVGRTTHGDQPVWFVRDNGAGFDPRFQHQLFNAFQRLHGTEEFEGLGIGLAIVQRVVRRHGGEVWAESEIDQGATFYFTLDGNWRNTNAKANDSAGRRRSRPRHPDPPSAATTHLG